MEPFPDLSTLSDDELTSLIAEREQEEERISQRRRALHARIDLIRAEHVRRLRESLVEGELPTRRDRETLERPLFEGTGDLPVEHDLAPLADLDALSADDLHGMLRELEREEDDVSLRRRFLHGQIDILRAERTRRSRGEAGLSVDDLAAILSQGTIGQRREAP